VRRSNLKSRLLLCWGGAIEIVQEGRQAYFFREQTLKSLMKVLEQFHTYTFDKQAYKKQ